MGRWIPGMDQEKWDSITTLNVGSACDDMTEFFINPYRTRLAVKDGIATEAPAFHQRMPGHLPTDIVDAPGLATTGGWRAVSLKLETLRCGLPSFKILGASYAMYWTLRFRYGIRDRQWHSIEELGERAQKIGRIMFVAATDGNHGRGVARMARLLGLPARIYIPHTTVQVRIDAIAQEEAEVRIVEGGYDDAVKRAAQDARRGIVLVQDTAWEGYYDIPHQVVKGYSTLFQEIDEAEAAGLTQAADAILLPIGIGALAEAAVRHYRREGLERQPLLIGYEPTTAACALASARAGRMVTVNDAGSSIMAGMNCGTLSLNSWPHIFRGLDAFLTIDNDQAIDGMRRLAAMGIRSSETGAASVAALSVLSSPDHAASRAALGLTPASHIRLIVTEGVTDPEAWARHVGASPPSSQT